MTQPSDDCSECGFADTSVTMDDAVAALRRFGKRYRAPLTRFLPGEDSDAVLRTRPAAGVWSGLEYAAHVRDVFGNYDRWIAQTLSEDRPVLEGPGPDEAAEAGRYNELDPIAVVDELAANAEKLAATLEAVPEASWNRVGIRRDEERSILFTARRAMHEGNHHLLDIGRVMRAVREQRKAAT